MNKKNNKNSFIDLTDDKIKLIIMISLIGVVLFWAVISNKNLPNDYDPFKNSPFDPNKNTEVEETNIDNFEKYLETIKVLSTKSYENIYTIETDIDEEYFYLRSSVDGNKKLYYKEFKNNIEIFLQKDSSFYIVGKNVLKKTQKKISYEGYDTILFDVNNLYSLIYNKEDYDIVKEDGIIKIRVKIDINEMIKIYNSSNNSIELLEPNTHLLVFDIYEEDGKFVINTDLKEYYNYVYKKMYESIIYDLEFYNIGSTSLVNIEDELTSID